MPQKVSSRYVATSRIGIDYIPPTVIGWGMTWKGREEFLKTSSSHTCSISSPVLCLLLLPLLWFPWNPGKINQHVCFITIFFVLWKFTQADTCGSNSLILTAAQSYVLWTQYKLFTCPFIDCWPVFNLPSNPSQELVWGDLKTLLPLPGLGNLLFLFFDTRFLWTPKSSWIQQK